MNPSDRDSEDGLFASKMEPRSEICMIDAFELLSKTKEAVRALLTMMDRGPGAREAALTLTKLQEAAHWLQDSAEIAGLCEVEEVKMSV